jgi:hypothetical protein
MKWLVILCLIVVLEIPASIWNKMPEQEKASQITTAITDFCLAYSQKYNIFKFKVRLIEDKDRMMLDIVPQQEVI